LAQDFGKLFHREDMLDANEPETLMLGPFVGERSRLTSGFPFIKASPEPPSRPFDHRRGAT
jgi:hypothetical protein